jgi:hypothetical protein
MTKAFPIPQLALVWSRIHHCVGSRSGSTDMFMTADGCSVTAHCIHKKSNKEYYDQCEYNHATQNRNQWKKEESTQMVIKLLMQHQHVRPPPAGDVDSNFLPPGQFLSNRSLL